MGFLHRVADDIRALKDLLKRYDFGQDGRAIYKELLQNADDAGATTLQVHLMDQGFAEGEVANPLLRGPALVVINDGAFRPIDARNMRYATGTSKSHEVGTVGRFGLGQKSVFHLCEAWFCVGSSEASGLVHCNIDPWAHPEDGDSDFPEWPVFGEVDQGVIRSRLAGHLHGQNWFVLWLPLRQPSHRRARSGVISDWFPTADQLSDHLSDLTTLGTLLPQMGRLRRLRVLRHRAPGDVVSESHVELAREASTLSRPTGNANVERSFQGTITSSAGLDIRYVGRERVQFVPSLLALQRHPQWPKTLVDDDEGITATNEQIAPHGAVTVVVAPAGDSGRLEMDWCVFLPLAENAWSRPLGLRCRRHVSIRLHGYFFPDHGRRQITGLDQPEPAALHQPKDFEAAWNVRLRDSVVLPCLIGAVYEALTGLDGPEQVAVVEALRDSPTYRSHDATVCEQQSLVRGLRAGTPFQLISSDSRLLPVPESGATSEARSLRQYLERAERRGDAALVLEAGPHLVPPRMASGWSREHLSAALGTPLEADLNDPGVLDAVAALLARVGDRELRDEAAADLLRRALRHHGPRVFASKRLVEGWKRLVASVYRTGVLRTRAPTVLGEISDIDLTVLILPSELIDRDTATVPVDDGRRVLERLSPIVTGGTELAEAAGRLVAEVVGAMGARAVLADPALSALPAFRVWSARTGGHQNISAARLLELRELGLAFAKIGLARPEQAATALLAAVDGPHLDVVLADETLAEPLGLPELSEYGLAEPLVRSRTLSIANQPSARVALLRRLLTDPVQRQLATSGTQESFTLRAAIRFLLHGREDQRRDNGQLWKAGHTQGLDHEAVKLVLDAQGNAWRLISEELTRDLSDQWMQLVEVRTLGHHELLKALEGLEPPKLRELGLRASHTARTFLLRITTNHPEVWRALPFHETVDGRQVTLVSGRSFRATPDWPLPLGLESAVDLIRKSDDPTIFGAQTLHIDPWTPRAQVSTILSRPQPSSWALECLDALDAFDVVRWPRELADVAWLPLASAAEDHAAVAPASVLGVPTDAAEHVASVLAGRAVFVAPSALSHPVRGHRVLARVLQTYALQGEDLVRALAMQLGETSAPELWVGEGAHELPFADVVASQGLAGHAGWQLVSTLHRELGCPDLLACDLVPVLARPINLDALLRILNALANSAEESRGEQREVERRVFSRYFDLAAHRADFPKVLRHIRILNRTGQWVGADRVARVGDNLALAFRLDEDLQRVVDEALERAPIAALVAKDEHEPAPSLADPRGSAAAIESYFDPWIRRGVRPEAVGLLATLLGRGDESSIWSQADSWLTPTTASSTWDWVFHKATTRLSTAMDSDHGTLAGARYTIELVHRDTNIVRTTSLAGTQLDAALATGQTTPDTIFVSLGSAGVGSSQCQPLRLLAIDDRQTREALNELLQRSIAAFTKLRLRRHLLPAEFQPRWTHLSESGQVQLSAVRQQILDNLATRLEVLQYKRHAGLAAAVTKLKRARQEAAEAEATFAGSGWAEKLNAPKRAATEAQRELVQLVEADAEVQRFLLDQVRRKLGEYQYGIDRVLWELAQNADDAAVQLQEMLAVNGSDSRAARRLRVEVTERRVRVTHWGRQINQHALAGFRAGRDRGWDLDLLNMMVLNTSDKSAEHGTTGRFGLGFKSVYLVSDRPRVGSGQLSFEVVAGMLPTHLEETPIRDDEWAGNEPPTVFELDLRPCELRAPLLDDLLAFGGLVTVFSKAIRELQLVLDSRHLVARWEPVPVPRVAGLEVGTVPVALGGHERTRLLVMRDGPVTVALLIADGRIQHPPDNAPSIWCTAPTKESWPLGMVINGPVAVDTGRSRVALDRPETRDVFKTAGRLLAETLSGLADAMEADWETMARALGFPQERSEDVFRAFWRSVWDVLSLGRDGSDHARGVLLRELHGGTRGLHGLARRRTVLPSLLPGAFDCLTSLGDVRYVAERELEESRVLEVVAGWTWVDDDFRPRTVVSKAVFDVLRMYEDGLRLPPVVSLTEILHRWGAPGGRGVDRARAIELHPIVDWLEMPFMTHSTRDELRGWMGSLHFPSLGRHGAESAMLLVPPLAEAVTDGLHRRGESDRVRKLEDEFLRARFAPSDALLDGDVACDAEAVRFFLACRRLKAGGQVDLERWAREANTEARQEAALNYCIRGELGHHLCGRFRTLPLSWFPDRATLHRSELVRNWRVEDRVDLQNALFPLKELDQPRSAPPVVVESETTVDRFFDRFQRWWALADNRRVVLEEYEAKAWPAWLRPALAQELEDDSDDHWLALLVLGASRSMGWATDAHHRSFLEAARERGWWATFLRYDQDDSWMAMLRTWQDESVHKLEYARWMSLFPTIYQLSRHLRVYRRLLRSADRRPQDMYDLQVLLAPRADENLSGAGAQFDAPPAPLNMGLHFVLRELVRLEVIAPHEHVLGGCWVPTSTLISFLRRLGLDIDDRSSNVEKTEAVHAFMLQRVGLDAVHLHLAFDIPLLKVASDQALQQHLGLEE
jgi:hypothetical protein